MIFTSSSIEGGDRLNDGVNVVASQVRTHWKAERALRDCLSNRKGAGPESEPPIGFRPGRRNRIVDQGVDRAPREVTLQCVATRMAHHEEMPDRLDAVRNMGQYELGNSSQPVQIPRGHVPAALVPIVETRQFHPQQRSLQRIEPRVESEHFVPVLHARAVVAQNADAVGELSVVRCYCAGIAIRAEVLSRIKAPAGSVAERAGPAGVLAPAVGLRRVLEYEKAAGACDLANGRHLGRLPVEMDRENGTRARGDGGLDAIRIEVVRPRVRLDGHGPRAGMRDGQPGGDVGVGWDDHLGAAADAGGAEHQMEGIESVGHADAVFDAAVGGKVALEGFDLLAEDVPAGLHDPARGGVELGTQLVVRRLHVEERYGRRAHRHHEIPCLKRTKSSYRRKYSSSAYKSEASTRQT